MAKRVAARELNHDNWDQEEEEEEAGTFQKVKILGLAIRFRNPPNFALNFGPIIRNMLFKSRISIVDFYDFCSTLKKTTEKYFIVS